MTTSSLHASSTLFFVTKPCASIRMRTTRCEPAVNGGRLFTGMRGIGRLFELAGCERAGCERTWCEDGCVKALGV
eukprot:scaffold11982_cov124-Isochrysis_galbana.AAC.1